MNIKPKFESLARGALIAASYSVLTILLAPISYGPVQFRISEALTLLPFYMPEAVPGLFAGCIVANFFGGYGLTDILAGSCATLIAAFFSRRAKNVFIAALYPVVFNMVIIGVMLHILISAPLLLTCLYVGLGEAGACYLIGVPLMKILEARKIIGNKN